MSTVMKWATVYKKKKYLSRPKSALLGVLLCLLMVDSASAALGWLQLYENTLRVRSLLADESPFVLDDFVEIGTVSLVEWAHFGEVWGYIDDTGVVRASASSGIYSGSSELQGRAVSRWRGTFEKETASERPGFTIYPTDLLLESLFDSSGGPGAGAPPNSFARWQIDVSVCGTGSQRAAQCRTVLNQETKLAGGIGGGKFYTLTRTERVSRVNPNSGSLETALVEGGPIEGVFDWGFQSEPVMYSTGLYEGTIALPDVQVGSEYTVNFDVTAEVYLVAQGAEGQGLAEAIVANVGDVLGATSGMKLEDAGTPASNPQRLCASDYDTRRYADAGGGSVADTYTGLIWQRCPLGFDLDNNATADLDDDTCSLVGQSEQTWSEALSNAAGNTLNGESWRLPNVKELATLVTECQSPTIEPLPFPNTPAGPFWSATPAAPSGVSDRSMGVNFLTGNVDDKPRVDAFSVRLVRDSADALASPLPTLSAGRGGVVEGDAGLTQLVFPVLLSSPQSQPVTVDYTVVGISADPASDFTPVAGTLTIDVDDVLGSVAVTVSGDTEVEGDEFNGAFSESIQLLLSNASSNVTLINSQALGLIFDDEPLMSIRPVIAEQVFEADGQQALEIVLERPLSTTVTVDYSSVSGSAEAGSDFASVNGQAVFTPGQTQFPLPVSITADSDDENAEDFFVDISNPAGNVRLATTRARSVIVDDDGPGVMAALNDTGVDYCMTDTSETDEACPQVGFPIQDGDLGRDVTDNDDADGQAGFSFTKLDFDGNPLPIDAFPEDVACVLDNVSGLYWEAKNQNSPRDLHYVYWDFVWVNTSGVNDGGVPGEKPALGGGMCWDTTNCGDPTNPNAGAFCEVFEPMQCDTETFIERVNEEGLCGFSDWRLATPEEGYSVLNLDTNEGPFHDNIMPSSFAAFSWSSVTTAENPNQAWVWNGRQGSLNDGVRATDKSIHQPARLVRGGVQP